MCLNVTVAAWDAWELPVVQMGTHAQGVFAGGRTALILAAKEGNTECVRLMLNAGADKNAKDKVRGWLALTNYFFDVNGFLAVGTLFFLGPTRLRSFGGHPHVCISTRTYFTDFARVAFAESTRCDAMLLMTF